MGITQSAEGLNRIKRQRKGEFALCMGWDVLLPPSPDIGTPGSQAFPLGPGLTPQAPYFLGLWTWAELYHSFPVLQCADCRACTSICTHICTWTYICTCFCTYTCTCTCTFTCICTCTFTSICTCIYICTCLCSCTCTCTCVCTCTCTCTRICIFSIGSASLEEPA